MFLSAHAGNGRSCFCNDGQALSGDKLRDRYLDLIALSVAAPAHLVGLRTPIGELPRPSWTWALFLKSPAKSMTLYNLRGGVFGALARLLGNFQSGRLARHAVMQQKGWLDHDLQPSRRSLGPHSS